MDPILAKTAALLRGTFSRIATRMIFLHDCALRAYCSFLMLKYKMVAIPIRQKLMAMAFAAPKLGV